ncbi:beclin 2 [Phyllostomus discolor]|uniref:Beclin-2 n=1 Tax=Phyllostomus discolor TaxID=89673 RepID=A0A6J2N9L6_9CHIR|nr:beclin-2 [Phyllostomus discolor]KAF6073102.1 beclin 2 [Phyllostomus discolor]
MSLLRFFCQRCYQPLRRTQSGEALGPDTSQEPAASKLPSAHWEPRDAPEEGSTSTMETDVQNGASGRTHPGNSRVSGPCSGIFTLLGKLSSGRTLHSIQLSVQGTFDILSGEGDGDQALCQECTDNLLEHLDSQLLTSESDVQAYKRRLERVDEDRREALQEELKDAEREEARLVRELEETEKNRERAAAALEAAKAETQLQEQQERQYRRDYSQLLWQQLDLSDELQSVENQLRYAQAQLAWLEKTNAWRATFEIRDDGPLASINSFRLGCLPAVPVGWGEISAAWGQAALLLLALSRKVGLQFRRFRLIPCGTRSRLQYLSKDSIELPLFFHQGRGGPSCREFDRAMLAFLDCMQQFKKEAERGEEPGVCMPCRVHARQGLIEEPGASGECYSIRSESNTEERWSKALQLVLTNLKGGLDWVSSRYCQK